MSVQAIPASTILHRSFLRKNKQDSTEKSRILCDFHNHINIVTLQRLINTLNTTQLLKYSLPLMKY